MEYTLEEKYRRIKEEILKQTGSNPIVIVKKMMHRDYINMHGPEHHFLDGAALLVACRNAGGEINVEKALETLQSRTIKMPGAMCGQWGICGSVASMGAALAVIHEVGPLSENRYYADDMELTSAILSQMAQIGGPRCCKRNAFLSISATAAFIKKKYAVIMETTEIECEFSDFNRQCIKNRCPFYPGALNENKIAAEDGK